VEALARSQTNAQPSVTAPSTVLAFDFGERYLGVAVGNTVTRLAQPLDIVGLALSMDGTEHAMSARCKRFARQLEGRFRLPVDLVDERLTSASAEELLRQSGKGGRQHKHLAHSLAAQIILQAWLDDPTQYQHHPAGSSP